MFRDRVTADETFFRRYNNVQHPITARLFWKIMPYASLGEFLAELQDDSDIVRIAATVDSALELSAITDRLTKTSPNGGPAIIFENVKNSIVPVITNLLGSRRRLCRCLGVANLDDVAANLDRTMPPDQQGGWLDSLKMASGWGGLNQWAPKLVKTAACQQVVRLGRDVSLWDLPVPRCWPEEEYPVLTSGHLVSRHPTTGIVHYSQFPLAITGPQELAWYATHHGPQSLLQSAAGLKQNLPVSISLGGDPILNLAMSLSGVTDARLFAGIMRGASLEQVRCRTNELDVPAGSEIVIEGYVDATNPKSATPITVARGNGRYVRGELPLIQVTAITHRANPVLPAVITATAPSEESWLQLAAERMTLWRLKRLLPEIVDIHQPFCAAGRNLLFVSLRKTVDHQARRVLHALWGMESIGQTKIIVIVDADQNVQQEDQVWFAVGTNACPTRDFVFADGLARDDDYTPLSPSLSSRVGIDATRKRPNERVDSWPRSLRMSDDILTRIQDRWADFQLKR